MPDRIYIPPGLTNALVVEVGGVCYERVEPSENNPTVNAIDNEFADCDACEGTSSSSSSSTESACCGPIGNCCFSENSTIDINVVWTPSFATYCFPGADSISFNNIPFYACSAESIEWYRVISGTENIRVTYSSTGTWSFIYVFNGSCTVSGNTVDAQINCCGTNGSVWPGPDTNMSGYNGGPVTFSAASFEIGINDNTCCNDNGTCITGDDADCDGFCFNPCLDCNPASGWGNGSDPEPGVASGFSDASSGQACDEYNTTYPFFAYGLNAGRCEWSWRKSGLSMGTAQFLLWFHPEGQGRTYVCGGNSIVVADGEWLMYFERLEPGTNTIAMKKTTGYACDVATGKISGSDTIPICDEHSCLGPITFTVPV